MSYEHYLGIFYNIRDVINFNIARHHRANLCKLLSVVLYLINRYYRHFGDSHTVLKEAYCRLADKIRAELSA